MQERAYAALSVIATTGSLIVYGLMQERVMTIGWGDDGEVRPPLLLLLLLEAAEVPAASVAGALPMFDWYRRYSSTPCFWFCATES
jgi:hypothetical protein